MGRLQAHPNPLRRFVNLQHKGLDYISSHHRRSQQEINLLAFSSSPTSLHDTQKASCNRSPDGTGLHRSCDESVR
ncbi:hypothetical protein NSK_006423 [Nannochloropsis salina CCMP1776]|uniref:Uncharacterized protein n=1 Tax=Nannochloropsis salina CCMP1776 TaxID=1027361 RepID=A0A4D9CUN6_9STRA|nr:hypothetical protein NSK_006423 [Nannochloropsis salina CCMP1776]|eukprot:TFJ82304.1 hypothetical protein NSK_006423 [Nannochloropsis salina CCMP1776]